MNTKRFFAASFLITSLAVTAPAASAAETPAGEAAFKAHCVSCHSLVPGLSTIAPDLTGVVGRKAGTVKGYKYSPALQNADFVWTPQKLDVWLQSPHKTAAETEMAFPGLKDQKQRTLIIEFLETYAPNK